MGKIVGRVLCMLRGYHKVDYYRGCCLTCGKDKGER
jgi:hypothetical protein